MRMQKMPVSGKVTDKMKKQPMPIGGGNRKRLLPGPKQVPGGMVKKYKGGSVLGNMKERLLPRRGPGGMGPKKQVPGGMYKSERSKSLEKLKQAGPRSKSAPGRQMLDSIMGRQPRPRGRGERAGKALGSMANTLGRSVRKGNRPTLVRRGNR
jgi:hypothetical protein